jgi:16S rRNA (adenine1518-N6/adenine1519-N6)-dimethyltransferase
MLRSSLKQITPMAELLLREAQIAPERRAEDLSVDEFARLAAIVDREDWQPR